MKISSYSIEEQIISFFIRLLYFLVGLYIILGLVIEYVIR